MQKSLHLCHVCLHQWRVPKIALKYPCNLPPPLGGRPSLGDRLWRPGGGVALRASGGDFKGGLGYGNERGPLEARH